MQSLIGRRFIGQLIPQAFSGHPEQNVEYDKGRGHQTDEPAEIRGHVFGDEPKSKREGENKPLNFSESDL